MRDNYSWREELERANANLVLARDTATNISYIGSLAYNIISAPANYAKSLRARQQATIDMDERIRIADNTLTSIRQEEAFTKALTLQQATAAKSKFTTDLSANVGSLSSDTYDLILEALNKSTELTLRSQRQRFALERDRVNQTISRTEFEQTEANRGWLSNSWEGIKEAGKWFVGLFK